MFLTWFSQFASVRVELASDVFDGPAWRGVSEVKRIFGFCFRCSLPEVKKITLAAPHHRKVSAPRPPLSTRNQPFTYHDTYPINIPHYVLILWKLKENA